MFSCTGESVILLSARRAVNLEKGRNMDPKYILVIVVIVVMGWFAFGIIYNLRTGDAYLRWLRKGLPLVGERTTLRWLGTSVVEMAIAAAKKPFRRLDTLIVFEPRDVPWMWLWAALNGRKDIFIFRAQLVNPPPVDLELANPATWTGRQALQQASAQGWANQSRDGLTLMAPPDQLERAAATLAALESPLKKLTLHCVRLSLRRAVSTSQLEVHMLLPDRKAIAADEWVEAFQHLAQLIGTLH